MTLAHAQNNLPVIDLYEAEIFFIKRTSERNLR